MKMTPGDVADRYSILLLKHQRLPFNAETDRELVEMGSAYKEEGVTTEEFAALYKANGDIFTLEAELKAGKLNNAQTDAEFAHIGRVALAVRNINAGRIEARNAINKRLGGFIEVKGNHCSEK